MGEKIDKKIDVLLLSGGAGTRVKQQIGDTPKALMKHDGKIAIDTVLYPFIKDDNKDVFSVNINVNKIEAEHFKSLNYKLCIEETRVGNAGAIKLFYKELSNPFLVIHNDVNLKDADITSLYISHLQNDSFLTMTVKNIGEEKERGIIVKKYNKVLGFTRERWVNCGLYCVSHKAVEFIEDGFQDIDTHLLPRLSAIHQLTCYEYNGFYEDWGK